MSELIEFSALERLVRPISRKLSEELARAVIEVQPDAETETHYHALADKNTEGTLTPNERKELEDLVRANTFLQILKLEARAALAQRPAA